MSRIHCLGGGLVGSFVTNRLASSGHEVHLFDITSRDTAAVMHVGNALEADHSSAELIVNMLPGSIGHEATKSLSASGHKIVDLSFSEITPDSLEGVTGTILWDVGIAPGLSNMLVAQAYRDWGKLDEVSIKVGGNPSESDDEWSYMAPFSPHDVIAEYNRPARIIRNGMIVEVPAMTELHEIDASGREMEAFLTDGLRSLLDIPCESMGEYTVRWPGHIQLYQSTELSPEDLVSKWAFDSERGEFTWMEIFVRCSDESRRWVIEDSGLNGDSSMARTTGIVTAQCAIAWLDRPDMLPPGVHAPEDLPDEVIELVIDVMRSEGISIELK